MSQDLKLAEKIRKALSDFPYEEVQKMGGLSFMINGKVCLRAHSNGELMVRCEPDRTDELLTKKGAVRFVMKGKPLMKGWLLISPEGLADKENLDFWVDIALDFIKKAK